MGLSKTIIFALVIGGISSVAPTTDHTLTPLKNSFDVTESVIKKIRDSHLFPEDFNILRHIVYFNTLYLEQDIQPGTGGNWKVTKEGFDEMKANVPASLMAKIEKHFGIQLEYKTLDIPLNSGLAAMTSLITRVQVIPQDLQEQAILWFSINSQEASDESVALFEARSNDIDSRGPSANCPNPSDVVFILDGSTEEPYENQEMTLQVFAYLMPAFPTDTTRKLRFGHVYVGDRSEIGLELAAGDKYETVQEAIQNGKLISGGPVLNQGLKDAADMIRTAPFRPEISSQTAVIFSLKESIDGVGNIDLLKSANVRTLVVTSGVESGISPAHKVQLKALAQNMNHNIFYSDKMDYTMFNRLITEVCNTHQSLPFDSYIGFNLTTFERKYFEVIFPEDVLEIRVTSVEREGIPPADVFYSYTEPFPSSAIYDGVLFDRTAEAPAQIVDLKRPSAEGKNVIYITAGNPSVGAFSYMSIKVVTVDTATSEPPHETTGSTSRITPLLFTVLLSLTACRF